MIDFPLASPDSTVDALLALPVDNPTTPILSPTSPSKHSHRASLGRFTKNEIQKLLREAYAMIMEKDRELTLAAKLRNHIIEENDILREKYSELVEYVKELNIFDEPVHDGDSGILLNADYELSPPPPPPRLRSTPRRMNSRYDEEDAIVSLEHMNQDLQLKLESALNENDDLRKKGDRRIRKLEHEIEQLRLELERACQTVQELEDQNQSLLSRNREEQRSRPSSQQSDRSSSPKTQRQIEQQAEDEVIEILITKITELEKLNDSIYSQKSDLEQQLEAAMYQLEDASVRVKDLEDTARDYNELQNAFERQSMHVAELSQSVEDQRSWIQNIFGQFSPRSVPGTFSPTTSPMGTTIRSPTRSSFLGSSGYSPSPTVRRRGTLLNELESEWFIQTTPTHNLSNTIMTPRTIAHSGYMASTPITGRSPLGSFQSPLSPIPFNNDYLRDVFNSDESKELLEESSGDESNEEETPRRGLFGWVGRLVKYLVKTVLKWCRFLFFLSMAVVIAIYRGPDGAAL
ncbi:hypothetical protein K493DRAFT_320398 [Basidiobolus meristosporus CBS 931.73]|uniref:Uncharacterized protein n=1 Tax=Basidiobolus meristosporus CBS 931.73 TaxID=1314790 RepID=A0A1Y1XAL6_9FUNG|nr:hypothetical protein K493DRAFT_320398 [Basidiobolus meristosporus CBS 931.73]|eukprot:ORX82757.1 hypothetical protein K493DRAFT_320398 [Basidiobolus meristosporus CBS 931.73]